MAGRIPEQFIDDLLTRVDIVELVEAYLPLRKTGRNFQALCPFHDEKTPSFTISREKQFYHCFGCESHGTAIGFLMKYRNLEFVEAVEEIAASVGLEIPREAGKTHGAPTHEIFKILEQARNFYEATLRSHNERERAISYLKGRDISGQVAKIFRLGYAPAGWRNLLDFLTSRGVDEDQIELSGLAIRRDRGGFYDRFRDRVLFPIHDRRGRVVGFGGRIIDAGEPKYLNSPETRVFHKGRELYGLHEALANTKKMSALIVVEGYMDVIALHQFGLTNAVATLGTALTSAHLEQLFRHVPEIVFCFDGDDAGRRAAWKALEATLPLMAGNRQVRFAFLPEGHDPDTAVREHGPEELFTVSNSFELSEYLIDNLKAGLDLSSGDGRARLVSRVEPYLLQIPAGGHRGAGIRLLQELTGIDERILREDLHKNKKLDGEKPQRRWIRFTSRTLEEHALAMLLQHPPLTEHLTKENAAFLAEELDDCALLLQTWKHVLEIEGTTTAGILERSRGLEYENRLNELAAIDLNIPIEAIETELKDAITRLVEKAEDRRFRRLTSIPLDELTGEQKEIVRDYARRKSSPGTSR